MVTRCVDKQNFLFFIDIIDNIYRIVWLSGFRLLLILDVYELMFPVVEGEEMAPRPYAAEGFL